MQDLINRWKNAADESHKAACRHADIYGRSNETYVELMAHAKALRECVENLEAHLESELDSGGMTPWGSGVNMLIESILDPRPSVKKRLAESIGAETNDMVCRREKPGSVEFAISFIGAWIVRGRYRHLVHDHNGFYRAVDEAAKDLWESDSIVGLADAMGVKAMH